MNIKSNRDPGEYKSSASLLGLKKGGGGLQIPKQKPGPCVTANAEKVPSLLKVLGAENMLTLFIHSPQWLAKYSLTGRYKQKTTRNSII